jgi:beta-glucosidase
MKRIIFFFTILAVCSQALGVQQARTWPAGSAVVVTATDEQEPVSAETTDSQAFFDSNVAARYTMPDSSAKVEALLRQMTLEEKVGQMTQLEIGQITDGNENNIKINPAKLEKAIARYGVGSILNTKDIALSIDKWHEIIGAIQQAAQKTRLKIPVIYGIDTIHGANYVQGATLFPQEIGMAATWNPELMKRAAELAAMETRAAAIPWNFSPVLDVGRSPLWPRLYETFGEDPYLAKVLGVASIRGYEGTNIAAKDKVAACMKHYMGYSLPMSGRDRTPSWIPEIYLREYFLPTFQAAVAAGAHTIMINSGEINGTPVHVSHYLLTEVLRNELGFRGLVVSDWQDIQKLVSQHGIAATEKDATRMAVNAGIDMSMVPSDYGFSDNLLALAKEGAVPSARIDEAVRRVLRLKYDLGLFDAMMPDASLKANLGTPAARAVSLQAARESLVLLRNDNNLLPLAKGRKVLVTGPAADSLMSLNNGWSYVWQGNRADLYPKDRPTILGAIRAKVGESNVAYVPGAALEKESNINDAVSAARDADVAVVCLGEGAYAETPGNIDDLTLPEAQLKLAEAIIATGKPVVLILAEGRPRIINRIAERIGTILLAPNPGNEGGQAIADVLFGDFNPCGKLPYTYPRHPNALMAYDHKAWESGDTPFGYTAYKPQFLFGYGLSYTTFAYSDLKLDKQTIARGGEVNISVTVKNTGQRAGKEVVQVYVRDVVASVTPPGKRLKRFAKVYLEPGQSRTLTFKLGMNDLSFIGADNKPVVEAGDFEVMVAGLKDKFTLTAK